MKSIFDKKRLLLIICVWVITAFISSCNYNEDEDCFEAPASCQWAPSTTGNVTIDFSTNSENPTVLIHLFRGTIESGTPVGTYPVSSSPFSISGLSLGDYSAYIDYKYGAYTITVPDGDSISSDGEDYCGGVVCYEDHDAELNLVLDEAELEKFQKGNNAKCFIATAAFGSPFSKEVMVLRDFRDRVLVSCLPGRAFVQWYYRVSPPFADYIRDRSSMRYAVRCLLTPVVFCIEFPTAAFLFLIMITTVIAFRKRMSCAIRTLLDRFQHKG
jgi:hypothetical protein